MATKIRLARGGSKKKPFYRIVVANSRSPRDGDFIEKIGVYNPLLAKDNSERVVMKLDRVSYWLAQGAQPSEKVAFFIEKSGVELPNFVKSEITKKKSSNAIRLANQEKKKAAEAAKA